MKPAVFPLQMGWLITKCNCKNFLRKNMFSHKGWLFFLHIFWGHDRLRSPHWGQCQLRPRVKTGWIAEKGEQVLRWTFGQTKNSPGSLTNNLILCHFTLVVDNYYMVQGWAWMLCTETKSNQNASNLERFCKSEHGCILQHLGFV